MAHKTNYKDALFEQRKYRMQNNPDGTVTPIDETDYTQEGDRIGALELNKIGEALNALEQEMGKRELQTYTALSQLSLEAPVTLSQLITAMPDGSYAAIDCNGTSVVSDIPSGSAAGSLEVVKVGDSGSAKYTNTSNGQVYFWGNGQWYAALVDEMVLGTMEEIDANTDAGKVAGALAVKELSSELNASKLSWKKIKDIGVLYNGPAEITIFANDSNDKISNYDAIVIHTSNQERTTHRNPHYCIIDEKAFENGAFQVIDISPNSSASITYVNFHFSEKTLVIEGTNASSGGIAIADVYGIAQGHYLSQELGDVKNFSTILL